MKMEKDRAVSLGVLILLVFILISTVIIYKHPTEVESLYNNSMDLMFDINKEEGIIVPDNKFIYNEKGNIIISKDKSEKEIKNKITAKADELQFYIQNGTAQETKLKFKGPDYQVIDFYCSNETTPLYNYTMRFRFEEVTINKPGTIQMVEYNKIFDLDFQDFCEYMRLYNNE